MYSMSVELTNIVCCVIVLTVHVSLSFPLRACMTLWINQSPVVRYLALLVSSATAGSVYPMLWPHRVKASHGTTAAGLAIGWTNACAQASGIVGPHVFSSESARHSLAVMKT
jgi:hypothetical protein